MIISIPPYQSLSLSSNWHLGSDNSLFSGAILYIAGHLASLSPRSAPESKLTLCLAKLGHLLSSWANDNIIIDFPSYVCLSMEIIHPSLPGGSPRHSSGPDVLINNTPFLSESLDDNPFGHPKYKALLRKWLDSSEVWAGGRRHAKHAQCVFPDFTHVSDGGWLPVGSATDRSYFLFQGWTSGHSVTRAQFFLSE